MTTTLPGLPRVGQAGGLPWLPPHSELQLEASSMSSDTLSDLHPYFPPPCLLLLPTCLRDSDLPHQPLSHYFGHLPHSLGTCPSAWQRFSLHTPHPHKTAGLPSPSSCGAFFTSRSTFYAFTLQPLASLYSPSQQILPPTLINIFVQCPPLPPRMQALQRASYREPTHTRHSKNVC